MSKHPTAGELASALNARKVSSVELVEDAIVRIEATDASINAVVVRDFDNARIQARAADARRVHGQLAYRRVVGHLHLHGRRRRGHHDRTCGAAEPQSE